MEREQELRELWATLRATQRRIAELGAAGSAAGAGSANLPGDPAAADRSAARANALAVQFALLDPGGGIRFTNDVWRRFVAERRLPAAFAEPGASYPDLCTEHALPTATAGPLIAAGIRAVLAGEVDRFEHDYVVPLGQRDCWFRAYATPLNAGDAAGAGAGSPDGSAGDGDLAVIVAHVDITEARGTLVELSRRQRLQRIVASSAQIGGWMVDLRQQRLEWSDEVRAIHELPFGFEPSLQDALQLCAPEWRDWMTEQYRRAAEDGQPFDGEFEVLTRTGRRRWIRSIAQPVRDAAGRVVRLEGSFQDITEYKEALATSDRRFREMADALPLMLWTARPDGRIGFANRAFFEYVDDSGLDVRNGAWLEVVHPDDLARADRDWQAAADSGRDYHSEFRLRRADGEYRWHRLSASPTRDDAGVVVKWYGIAEDVHDRMQMEAEARELELRLQRTLESMGDGFFTLDPEYRFTYLNASAERMLRRPRETLLGRGIREAFPGPTDPEAMAAYETAMRERRQISIEYYFEPLDGHFGVNLYPDDAGGLAVYLRDITEQMRARRRLAESEARFRAVARAAADVVWEWDLAAQRVWWGEGLERMFALPHGGEHVDEATWLEWVHPDDRADLLANAHALAEARNTDPWVYHYRMRSGDGVWRSVENRGQLVLDADGAPLRLVGGMQDVTERERVEATLRQQATLLDQARDAIIVHAPGGEIRYWNRGAERMYGWSAQEAVGRAVGELLQDEPEPCERATEAVMESGAWRGRLRQRRRDGSALTIEGHWSQVKLPGEQESESLPTILAINTDISLQVELEQQLDQAQRLESIGQLTGGIAHDFNNLLTVIMGNSELLTMRLVGQAEVLELASAIQSTAERAAELTQRLLAFARKQPLEPVAVDVNALVAGMDGLLRRTLGEQIEIELVSDAGLWTAMIDAGQLESAVLNLSINARDAMPRGGKLTLETANVRIDDAYAAQHADLAPGQYVLVAVSDTGTGMDAATLARVFDPFFTTKDVGRGSGLGLSMVYGFAKQSRGHVAISSELGAGTTIRLYLPRAFMAEARAEPPARGELPGGSERILLVEDDDAVRAHLGAQLERLGYPVVTASDGAEALQILKRDGPFDLLFTDIVMPGGMTGRQLAVEARALHPELPVLFTSGYTESSIVHQGRLDHGVHLLNKPFRLQELALKVRRVLDEDRGVG